MRSRRKTSFLSIRKHSKKSYSKHLKIRGSLSKNRKTRSKRKSTTRISFSKLKQKWKSLVHRYKKVKIPRYIDLYTKSNVLTQEFNTLYLDYPNSTKVYPTHPLIKKYGSLIQQYSFHWGSLYIMQTKERVAVYAFNDEFGENSLPPLKDRDPNKMYIIFETPYKSVLYGKSSVIFEDDHNNYWRIDCTNGLDTFHSVEITHFFSDLASNGSACNVFWVTSDDKIYIEYNEWYDDDIYLENIIFADDLPYETEGIRVKGLNEFLKKFPTMTRNEVSLYLRRLIKESLN